MLEQLCCIQVPEARSQASLMATTDGTSVLLVASFVSHATRPWAMTTSVSARLSKASLGPFASGSCE
jgi:hypothetical protein